MAPDPRFVPRFAAEPPHDDLPYGRWAERLSEHLLAAWASLDVGGGEEEGGVALGEPSEQGGSTQGEPAEGGAVELGEPAEGDAVELGEPAEGDAVELGEPGEGGGVELGEPGEIVWYPDRSWHGWTYVPASTITTRGYELYGYVRFAAAQDAGEPSSFTAKGDFTSETAERNPDWRLDICEEPIGSWRGKGEASATMTLIWGRPLLAGGWAATAELGGITVDQCELREERFTLIAPDDYQHDLLEVALWDRRGQEIARESLYEPEDGELPS